MNRRALLGPRFGQEQCSVGKIEGRLAIFTGDLRAFRFPVKSSGDHQMNDQEKIVFELENDALTNPAERQNFLAFGCAERRFEGAQDKRAAYANLLNRLIQNAL